MSKYPFTAIVGQETMKTALILHAVDPTIGGVLIRGHKGTAKSTAVRSLAELLPPLDVVDGCPYHCDPDISEYVHDECRLKSEKGEIVSLKNISVPLVELPLGATEDRLAGSLHVEKAIHEGERVFEPGLLAAANRGILYVDEVNLLDDHLVDLLLDTSASGVNRVEREGLSVIHPSEFILIGTMNPEEGELRPQFLDRFGLCVKVAGEKDVKRRSELVKRRLAYEKDPVSFTEKWNNVQNALREQIVKARLILKNIIISDEAIDAASSLAVKTGAQGHRAEITITKAAAALAAFQERTDVTAEDIFQAAAMALPHRLDRFIEHGGEGLPKELVDAISGVLEEMPFLFENKEEEDEDDRFPAYSIEDEIFPGSTAGGVPIFSFLKKKHPELSF